MDTRQLRYFAAVAREGSISRAAARLGIAQPAVSRRIADLEAEAGVPLLLRHGRGVQMTEAGTDLLARAESIIAELTEAERELAARRSAPGGMVAIGMTHAMAATLGPRLVRAFRARHPDVLVRVMEGFGVYLREQLARGAIHAALMYDPPRAKDLRVERVGQQDMHLVGRAGEVPLRVPSIPFAALEGLSFVLPRPDHVLRQQLERITRQQGWPLRVLVEAESASTMRALILDQGVFSILPYPTVRSDIEAGLMGAARIVKPSIESPLALVTAPWLPLSAPARYLIATARRELVALMREGHWPVSGHDVPPRQVRRGKAKQ